MQRKKNMAYRGHGFFMRTVSLVTAATVFFCYMSRPGATIRVDAAETTDEITYYEWTGVTDIVGTFNKTRDTSQRVMIAFDKDGKKYASGTAFNKRWYGVVNMDNDRQVDYYETR